MNIKGYLIVSKSGNIKFRKTAATDRNEIPIYLEMEIPSSWFDKPVIKLKASMGPPYKPIEITREMEITAQENVERALGIKVELIVPREEVKPNAEDNGRKTLEANDT